MEFRLRPLGFMKFFTKQQLLTAWWLLFCKKLHETQDRSLNSMELDKYI